MKKVLVTGSRSFTDRQMLHAVLDLHNPDIVIHGAARGADHIAHEWCRNHHRVYEISVPAKWEILGRPAGPHRNTAMLNLKPDVVVAFFKAGAENRGTTNMVEKAQEAGIRIERFWS